MYSDYDEMVAELGEDEIVRLVNRQVKSEDYRKAYSKKKNANDRAILKAYREGRLGGTRVDMTREVGA